VKKGRYRLKLAAGRENRVCNGLYDAVDRFGNAVAMALSSRFLSAQNRIQVFSRKTRAPSAILPFGPSAPQNCPLFSSCIPSRPRFVYRALFREVKRQVFFFSIRERQRA